MRQLLRAGCGVLLSSTLLCIHGKHAHTSTAQIFSWLQAPSGHLSSCCGLPHHTWQGSCHMLLAHLCWRAGLCFLGVHAGVLVVGHMHSFLMLHTHDLWCMRQYAFNSII
jgi:hypothetical protein